MKNYNLVVAINVLFFLTLAIFLLLYPEDFDFGDPFSNFTWSWSLEMVNLPKNFGLHVAALAFLVNFASIAPTDRSRRLALAGLTGLGAATILPAFILQNHLLQNTAGFLILLTCFLLAIVNGLAWIRHALLNDKNSPKPPSNHASTLQILSLQALRAAIAAASGLVITSWIAAESTRNLLLKLGSSISGFEDVGGIGGVTFTLLLAIAASLAFAWPETRNLLSLERSMGALPSRLSGTAEEATAPVPLAQSPLLFQLNQQLRALAGGSALQETRERWVRRLGEAAASEERNRLARELHDSIKQQLFSIKMSAAATAARWNTDPPGAQSSLEDVRRCAHEAMVEMQALLLQLRPEALANVGLVEALKEQGEALQYRSGATVHCDIGELPPESQLPPAIQ